MSFTIETIIEIPKGSNVKYEMENGRLVVDRIMYGDFVYPENYGFIKNTIDWDGDPLDVLVIADAEIIPGAVVEARVVGAMKMIDEGETDTKLIAYVNGDVKHKEIKTISDVPKDVLNKIETFFKTYKDYKGSKIEITGFEDVDFAKHELEETKKLFAKYKDKPKKEFISKMMKQHPEKYNK